MKSWHVDVGNSASGPVGFCARIRADTAEKALEVLRRVMPETVELKTFCEDTHQIEYLNVYFNPSAVTVREVADPEEVQTP